MSSALTLVSPADGASFLFAQPLEWTTPVGAFIPGKPGHFQVQIASDSSFNTIVEEGSSWVTPGRFEYFTGGVWTPLPSTGLAEADFGKDVRFNPLLSSFVSGPFYWRVRREQFFDPAILGDTYDWSGTNAYGGGHVNGSIWYPDGVHLTYYTDVSGVSSSEDNGSNNNPANRKLPNSNERCAACFKPHPDQVNFPGYGYALVGDGGQGALWETRDYAKTFPFRHTGSGLWGNGNNNNNGLPNPHPRSVGHGLIQFDLVNNLMYVGTFKRGVMRASLSDLSTWATIGLASVVGGVFANKEFYIRTMAFYNGTLLAFEHSGVTSGLPPGQTAGAGNMWRCKNPEAVTPTWEKFTNVSTIDIEEAVMFGTTLVCTKAVVNGVYFMADPKNAALSTALSTVSGFSSDVEVGHIAGRKDADGECRAIVGVMKRNTNGPMFYEGRSFAEFQDGGTWKAEPTSYSTQVSDDLNEGIGTPDTLAAVDATQYLLKQGPGGCGDVHPTNKGEFITAGRPYHTKDGLLSASAQKIHPRNRGLRQISMRGGTMDQDNSDHFFLFGLDRGSITTLTGINGMLRDKPPAVAGSFDGLSGIFDPYAATPKSLYGFYGDAVTNGPDFFGEVFRKDFPSGTWTQILRTTAINGTDYLPTGGIIVRDPVSGNRFLVVAARGLGVIYKNLTTGAAWAQATSAGPAPGGNIHDNNGGAGCQRAIFRALLNSAKVYSVDRNSAVWRSSDFGRTAWTPIHFNTDNLEGQGFVVVDPSNENTIYYSKAAGVYQITNAGTAGANGATLVSLGGAFNAPGPIGITPQGDLMVCDRYDAGTRFKKAKLSSLSGPTTPWRDISGEFPLDGGPMPQDMEIHADGTILLSVRGTTVVVGKAIG